MRRYTLQGFILHTDLELPFCEADDAREGAHVELVEDAGLVRPEAVVPVHEARTGPRGEQLSRLWWSPEHLVVEDVGWRVVMDMAPTRLLYRALAPRLPLFMVLERLALPMWQLAMRRVLGLHAGAAVVGGRTWVIVGESGAGKSTTTLALSEGGGCVVGDDLALIGEAGQLWPGAAGLRLWSPPRAYSAREHVEGEKYWYRVGEGWPGAIDVGGIIALERDEASPEEGVLRRCRGAQALVTVLRHSVALVRPPPRWRQRRFEVAAAVAGVVEVLTLSFRASSDGKPAHMASLWPLLEGQR